MPHSGISKCFPTDVFACGVLMGYGGRMVLILLRTEQLKVVVYRVFTWEMYVKGAVTIYR